MALFARHGLLPGGGARPGPHRRGAEPGDREGAARLGAGADQRAARLLDAGDRHRAAAGGPLRAAGAAGAEAIARGGGAAVGGAVPGDPERRRRGARAGRSRPRRRSPSGCRRRSPAATSTTTPFRAAIRCRVGPLGYNGSKAAMELIAQADVVLALGTRLNPFSTLPGYGIDYWPKAREADPGRHQPRPDRADQAGERRRSPATRGWWPRRSWPRWRLARASRARRARGAGRTGRARPGCSSSRRWTTRTTIRARPGTRGRGRRIRSGCRPRMAWRAIQAALPKEAIISSDIGNNCAIGNAYPTLRGGAEVPGAGAVRAVRLRLSGDRRGEDRLPGRAGGRLRRRRRVRHLDDRDDRLRARRMAGDHHGGVPQLPVGRGEAELDALVRRQLRRHRARPGRRLCRRSRGPAGSKGVQARDDGRR